MTPLTFVSQALAQVTVRPRKLGYLVKAGNGPEPEKRHCVRKHGVGRWSRSQLRLSVVAGR